MVAVDEVPVSAHLLQVLEEPWRPVVGGVARPAEKWTCVTKFEPILVSARIGQGVSRERGAHDPAGRAHRATHLHRQPVTRLEQLERLRGGAGRVDYHRMERCFSSAYVHVVSAKGCTSSGAIEMVPEMVPAPRASSNSQLAAWPGFG